jgi:hypothetical protein
LTTIDTTAYIESASSPLGTSGAASERDLNTNTLPHVDDRDVQLTRDEILVHRRAR